MIDKMVTGLVGAAVGVFKLAFVVVLVIAFISWAKASPEDAQAALTKVIDAAVAVITWGCDQIIALTS
jgi:hypothetical protein